MGIDVDVRIIAATNADLIKLASEGKFKQDLIDRLSFEVLFLPPLRERREDILFLANHFASRMAFELGRDEIPEFTKESVDALEEYSWPGNVRELKNLVERAVYRSQTSRIEEIVFDPFLSPFEGQTAVRDKDSRAGTTDQPLDGLFKRPLKEAVKELKIHLLKKAIKETKYNQRAAARKLGLTYHQFRGLYRKFREELE